MTCRICQSQSIRATYSVREMMNGTREAFDYFECDDCGCLQIARIPENMAPYYDTTNYYSFQGVTPLRRLLWEQRLSYLATGRGVLGRIVASRWPPPPDPTLFIPPDVDKTARILDVGCGGGTYVRKLCERGFSNVSGIDPFMDDRSIRDRPFSLRRKSLLEMGPDDGLFDVIRLRHVFEHIAEQQETLSKARTMLTPNGYISLAIPWAQSHAWEHYRVNWVGLDAPRHFFLHTEKSMKILANDTGLEITQITYDSTPMQFWASEQYCRDIPLRAANSYGVNPDSSIFNANQIEEFDRKAQALNSEKHGDQVSMILKRR